MAEFRPGEVVLVRFPFTNLSGAKLRPATVLAAHAQDVVVVGIFSTFPSPLKPAWVLMGEKDLGFDKTGLKRSSVMKCEKLATLDQHIIHSTIGRLPQTVFNEVRRRVKIALELD